MEVCTQAAAHASRRRSRAALGVAALCAATATMLFSAGAAPAAITTGPVDPASGFPFSYTDDVQRFSVEQCQDDSGFCLETPRPDPAQPISVPDNYTADGEGFWWLAEATVPHAGRGQARFVKESAFANEDIIAGDQVSFSRIRFRFQDLVTGDRYRVTHPYGVDEFVAEANPDGGGLINSTSDVGCITPPCGAFPALAGDPITSFLQWDPSVGADPPAGYIGNPAIPHKVIGSPFLTNFVRLEHIVPQAPPALPLVQLVGETDDFVVQGKLAGPPPPPAPHIGLSATRLDFPARQVGSPSGSRTVQVTNHGTADMHVQLVAPDGVDKADFAVGADACSGQTVAPGASCNVDVSFAPTKAGDLSATLSVPSDSAGSPHGVALSGRGDAPAAAGGAGSAAGGTTTTTVITQLIPVAGRPAASAVAATRARALRVSGLSLARRISVNRARDRGLRVAMNLPSGTQVVRLAVFRARNGRAQGSALARAVRLPSKSGRYAVTLRSRALLRSLRPGRYLVQVTPGRSLDDRGATSTAAFTITR
jgi:hypothetical protein